MSRRAGERRRGSTRRTPARSTSAIWIAFSAAPLRRLSQARNSASPFGAASSARMRPTSTSSPPAASRGVGNSGRREDAHARRLLEDLGRLGRRERLLELHPDRLGMADEHRHADARGADREVGQLEDLAGLGPELRLLVGFVALPRPVHDEVVPPRRLGPELLHALRAGARDGLVRGDVEAPERRRLVQRLQHARERNRAAVRVRDDAVAFERLERADRVHLRHDERVAVHEPVGGRLVDADRARRGCDRDEGTAGARADGEEEEVDVAAPSASGVASSTRISSSPNGIRDPADRDDANARVS